MLRSSKLLFVLADGGHARLVERSSENGRFLTTEEIDGAGRLQVLRQALRASPPARAHSSTSPRRSAVGREDYLRLAKEAFMREVADRAAKVCRGRAFEGVVLAAPAQLVGQLRKRLDGLVPVAGVIRKDLMKTPNSELGAWLNEIFVAPQPGR